MRERLRIAVRGAVQGVGFRPFVFRLAEDLAVSGWVRNSTLGVSIEVEGRRPVLDVFRARLAAELPPRAAIHSLEASWLDAVGHAGFQILDSVREGAISALVLPDLAMCDDCRREILDPANRRYRYPFTNCTNCGPRFSIIESLPYDRANTSMRHFTMCGACRREYHDPHDRRFHAQPNACPHCGPRLAVWDVTGEVIAEQDAALHAAAAAIRAGDIVAVKGLGGFHLMCDAGNAAAIGHLRKRKHRDEKPFAVMHPDLATVRRHCLVADAEARLLTSPESPIVLLARRADAADGLAPSLAPGNPNLGVMLPYTPLHELLVRDVGGPVVATSGNQSDEPICTDEHDAIERLATIADLFLVHDRPIVRHVDDSIVRIVLDRELVLRRARGYAPLPIPIKHLSPPVLAVGAHLKNTVALASGTDIIVSQHIGDLESAEASAAFVKVLTDLPHLYEVAPVAVVADLHPDYRSTRHAASLGLPVSHVQHHVAHVAACMAENELDGPALGVAWDGTGYGLDGTVWGGEFFAVNGGSFTRVACLRPFQLPGGDRAIREPRRSALGALHAIASEIAIVGPSLTAGAFSPSEQALLIEAMARGVNAPVTTSAGRLFDAVASIAGLRQRASFEGQAAMDLEFAIAPGVNDAYPFALTEDGRQFAIGSWQAPRLVIDWAPMVRAILDDAAGAVAVGVIAARAHNTMVEMMVATASFFGQAAVVLSGGCFQNRYLTEQAVTRLRRAGFRPYWHQRIPPNDGGIALGQIAAYLRAKESLLCASPFPDASSRLTAPTPCFAAAGLTSPAS